MGEVTYVHCEQTQSARAPSPAAARQRAFLYHERYVTSCGTSAGSVAKATPTTRLQPIAFHAVGTQRSSSSGAWRFVDSCFRAPSDHVVTTALQRVSEILVHIRRLFCQPNRHGTVGTWIKNMSAVWMNAYPFISPESFLIINNNFPDFTLGPRPQRL